jgi:DNA polymerase V
VSEISHIKEAVSYHATIAGEKLRAQNSVCNRVGVIISTNRFKDEPQYSIIEFEKLVSPVCFTSDIVKTAFSIVDKVFKTGYSYKRCGVILTDITGNSNLQAELFEDRKLKDNKISLGKTIDTINQRFGKEKIHVGSFNQQKEWEMKRCFKSPDYTTRWKDLPLVR